MFDRRPRPIVFSPGPLLASIAALLITVLCPVGPVWAQDKPETPPEVKLSGSAGAAGLGLYQNERWGIVQAVVTNPTDSEQRVRVFVSFESQASHQFGRTVTVPARTSRQIQMPVRMTGATVEGKRGQMGNQTFLFDDASEQQIDEEIGLVRAVEDPHLFVVIGDAGDTDDNAAKAIEKVRETAGLPKTMAYAAPARLMRYGLGWDGVTTAVLLNDGVELDGAQSRALRDWLNGGGTLVVFADQVDSDAARRVLGDDFTVATVDRVTLTTLNFTDASGAAMTTVHTEEPFDMTRVVAPGFDTLVGVNGWPAVLKRDYGRGRLIVITAEGRAWTDDEAMPAVNALVDLLLPGGLLMGAGPSESIDVLDDTAAISFVRTRIGRKVITRDAVAIVLVGFVAVLIVVGVIVGRKSAGEWLGVIGAVAAVVATGALLALGSMQSSDVEPTAAALQLVRVQPGRTTAQVQSMSALYDPAGGDRTINGKTGWAWPIPLDTAGKLYRMTWQDLDAWTWPKVELPTNAELPMRAAMEGVFDEPVMPALRYGPDGLTGTIAGVTVTDGIVATGQANMSITSVENPSREAGAPAGPQTIAIPAAGVLPPGQYFTGSVLGDVQQDRAALFDVLLAKHRYKAPTLLAWSNVSPAKMNIEPDLGRNVQALYEAPLRVEPAKAGDNVRVPWPMITMTPQRVSDEKYGLVVLPLWRPDKQTWIEDGVPGASAFIADFQLPAEVLPIELTGAKVHLDLTAAGRPVKVMSIKDGKVVVLNQFNSPDGPRAIDVDPKQFEIQPDGRIKLAFEVGLPAGADARTVQMSDIWKIRYFGLEVAGTVKE